jgi:tmRNA-binding protein
MAIIELRLTGSHLIKQISSSMRNVVEITTSRTKSIHKQEVEHLVVGGESTSMTIVDVSTQDGRLHG